MLGLGQGEMEVGGLARRSTYLEPGRRNTIELGNAIHRRNGQESSSVTWGGGNGFFGLTRNCYRSSGFGGHIATGLHCIGEYGRAGTSWFDGSK